MAYLRENAQHKQINRGYVVSAKVFQKDILITFLKELISIIWI